MADKYIKIETPKQYASIKKGDLLLEYPLHGDVIKENELSPTTFSTSNSKLYQVSEDFPDLNEERDKPSLKKILIKEVLPKYNEKLISKIMSDLLNGFWWLKVQ